MFKEKNKYIMLWMQRRSFYFFSFIVLYKFYQNVKYNLAILIKDELIIAIVFFKNIDKP